ALPLHLDLERAAAGRLAAIAGSERSRGCTPLVDRSRAEERRPLPHTPRGAVPGPNAPAPRPHFAREVGPPRRDLAVVLVEPAGVPVDPGLDLEAPATDGIDVEASREAIVAERHERRLPPTALGTAVADDPAEHLVPVAGDRRADLDAVA